MLATHADVWPIDETAGAVPPNWPGWPDGKRFAFVLTHDVEGNKGLARVEQLMSVEAKHGFHSSFNLVPENEYRLSDELKEKIEAGGFEVGVHGLYHDGKLYSSKAEFYSRAGRIKEYIRKWNAVGFRSPLMQHKLAWLHELGVEYDASTFDTDPFEPEPDGFRTIFPFWVPGPNGTGYVELPYTLIQDFNLFVILQQKNINYWKQKIDWIAEHGGMALLNTHPDYMCFEGERSRNEFPISLYEELLTYVRTKHEGTFWTATPREVSRFYCAKVPPAERNTRKKICMVAHNVYDHDNRVRRYAECLAGRGDQVDVLTLPWSGNGSVLDPATVIKGVNVFRIGSAKGGEKYKWVHAFRLLRYLLVSSRELTRRQSQIKYDLIHVHNVPDFLVFAAWYPKWTGAKIILDIHDIVPELFESKFAAKSKSPTVALLRLVEKASTAFADHVIVANHLWHKTLVSRSVRPEKCSVFLNHVDPQIFYRRPKTRNDGKFIILFPGSFQWHQGLDLAIEAFARIKDRVPNAEFHLYGGGSEQAELERLIEKLGVGDRVKFKGHLDIERMSEIMANSDLGVVPKRADSFGNEAYSTKIMEFMSQGIPVVASRTKIDSFYFNDTQVRFFTSGDVDALVEAMLDVIENASLRESLIASGLEYVSHHGWDLRRRDYLELVDSLTTEVFDSSERTFTTDRSPAGEAARSGRW
jgi:glycosyltransferase involved in cell wall biosynthesis/peptidoglycan/xylan/chitin deacetylase (PgdA/CDA1 family)